MPQKVKLAQRNVFDSLCFTQEKKTAKVKESNCRKAHTFSEEMCNWLLPRTLFSQIIFTLKPKLRLMVSGHCIMYSQRSEVQTDLSQNGDWLISKVQPNLVKDFYLGHK